MCSIDTGVDLVKRQLSRRKGNSMLKRNGIVCYLVAAIFMFTSVFGVSMSYATVKVASVEVKPGLLTGTVTDMDKDPLANVIVKVVNISGNVQFSATTDIAGKYSIQNIPPGNYTLMIGDHQKVLLGVKQEAEISVVNAMLTLTDEAYTAGAIGSLGVPMVAAITGGVVIIGVIAYGISAYDSEVDSLSP